jgi:hypothetical protein
MIPFAERVRQLRGYPNLDPRETTFIHHNERLWRDSRPEKTEGEILLEANPMASSIISFSYVANVLASIHRAGITGYILKERPSSGRVDHRLMRLYRSFNTERFIYLDLNPQQRQEQERLFADVYPRLKSKKDVEDLQVDGVWFGDLLYDSHLMISRKPTIDPQDPSFRKALREALGYYLFWRDYLRSHPVKAVVLSHCVYYHYGILLRLAVQQDIPVYQSNASHLYRLSGERLWAYDDFYDYPEQFHSLPPEVQERGLKAAQERLERRFSGEVGVDMHYSTMSSYTRPTGKRIIPESPRIKVLIATHCFFDSPHPYGVNLFPDFYEWLTFLGSISERTDYDWYIKTHPDFLPGNKEILEGFVRRFPRFTLIPSESSHLQLMAEGIRFGLTVYGTMGFEYAALGIPVINASLCNPHIRYGFNIHPRTVDELEKVLLDLPNVKLDIDPREVLEYYYMAHLHYTDNWLFKDFQGLLKEIGGYNEQFTPVIYKKFLGEFSVERHHRIKRELERFAASGAYRFLSNGSNG